ncbi:MAG: imidazole glycerol phosphate synthase subunit HisF [Planctomycetaceae bacterium]|nr:imidazole glycerol phosphate synthase subunit HisF [Planctomycetaceae bacterium]
MNTVRVIARLDIKGPNLVKGIHLEGLRVLGKPEEFARHYYEMGADELIYQDVVASLYERNSLADIISRTASQIFIPLTVGGGLRTLEDISAVLAAGADKVSINTAAIQDPELIRQAARRFGSSTIVVAIEAIREPNGRYLAYTDNGRQHTGIDAIDWAAQVEELGAGEIVATSVDRDGTGEGYDPELNRRIADAVSIPVIAHGGPGRIEHIPDVIHQSGVDAVAVAGMLHYDAVHQIQQSDPNGHGAKEGNREFLKSGRRVSNIQSAGIPEIKLALAQSGIPCRISSGMSHPPGRLTLHREAAR